MEYHVIDVGFIGSFLEERADNDGDTLRQNISINVPDNNIYVINPVTGILESKVGNANTNDPQFVQFNSDKPSSPTTDLIIKNIGRTIKVTNKTNTEICVREKISGSNYVYTTDSVPSGAEECLKSIYFTSNKGIHWPKLDQTYAVLDDLSKKIPYDEGFSKKYYKIHPLTEDHLKIVEKETKISYDFLKKLHTLFLFDSEYPDNIEYSKIKLSPEWDGYSVDKNDRNNLVYSDYFKTGSTNYANYVFLVPDRTIDDLHHYFVSSSFKDNYFGVTNTYNPELWIDKKNERKENYGNLISLKPKPSGSFSSFNSIVPDQMYFASEEEILKILEKIDLYRMDPSVTDLDLVEDIVSTNIFMDIVETTDLFVCNKKALGEMSSSELTELQNIEFNINFIRPLLRKYEPLIRKNKMSINNKVFDLIKKYFDFQLKNNLPFRRNIFFSKDKFETLFHSYAFYLSDSSGLNFSPEELTRKIIIIDENIYDKVSLTTASISIPPINASDVPIDMRQKLESFTTVMPQNLTKKTIFSELDYKQTNSRFITKPIFENGLDRQKNFYTASAPINHTDYYIRVYTDNPESPLSKHLFDMAYAHISGSGSTYINKDTEHLPAKTLYKKYLAECFGNQEYMVFKNNVRSDYFYILEFNRHRYKDRIDSEHMQITLSPIYSNENQLINTGSNFSSDENSSVIYKLIDDSRIMKVYSSSMFETEEYYNLVEGTQQDGLKFEEENVESWGMIFPKRGLILLDGQMMDKYCNFNTVTASINGDNIKKMFISISSSCSPNSTRSNHEYWYMKSAQNYSDQNYYCRINRNEFNHSNNYTYISGSNRKFLYDKINNSTKVYITTIGLYDDDANLLAIAKLSKPLLKDSSEEYVFNIKLKSN